MFLDASKAFDKINHWFLFSKLLARNIPCVIVRLLVTWYSSQSYVVRWSSCYSMPFNVTNGVPQGRILSPSFFNVYMDDLSYLLNKASIGCIVNGTRINHMLYADDSNILAPSPSGLQKLLDICFKYCSQHEIKFNIKKSQCMCFRPKSMKFLKTRHVYLGGHKLDFVDCKKYLGCFINENLCDDNDIKRLMRSVYTRGNILIKKFRFCTEEVKAKLFKSYCSSFYGCVLWSSFTDMCYHKLVVAYKQVFRNFIQCRRQGTTMQMLRINIDPYDVIYRKLVYSFRKRTLFCDNGIIQSITSSHYFYTCRLFKRWNKVLF